MVLLTGMKPTGTAFIVFGAWLLAPTLLTMRLVKTWARIMPPRRIALAAAVSCAPALGWALITAASSDAQGGIAVLMTPFVQFLSLGVVFIALQRMK